jgi:hypothetical protein
MTTLTTDTPLPPPPPPSKARRKPRSTPPPPLPAVGTPVPLHPEPAPCLDLGATLAEAAEAASQATERSECDIPSALAPAEPPPGRPLEEIAGDYRGVFHGSLWECARYAAEAVRAHGDTSLARLARLAEVDRPRLVEHALLGKYWSRDEDKVTPASASAHLYAVRLARKRLGRDADDQEVIRTARVVLLQSHDCKTIQALIRAEKHAAIVPPPVDQPEEPPPVDDEETAFAAVQTWLHGVRDYLASSPPAERYSRVVDALKAILAEANEARKVTEYQPEEDLDDDAGDADDGDDEDSLGDDDAGDQGDLDFDFDFEG